MHDRIYQLLRRLSEKVERVEAAVPAERSLSSLLGTLLIVERLALIVSCLRERKCVNAVRVLDGNVRTVFVKSGLIGGGSRSSLHDYDGF